jgi:predicted small lipoprotein YifL
MMRLALTLMLTVIALGACGKKGDLRPPPGYEQTDNTPTEG